MINSYLDIISLSTAKNYLRIDSTTTEDDAYIETLITASLQWVEKYTNHIMVEQVKDYFGNNDPLYCASQVYKVYDFPIVMVNAPAIDEYVSKRYDTNTRFSTRADQLTLTLGYNDASELPASFVQAALAIIQVWYYNSENMQSNTLIPGSVRPALNPYRRFPLF